VIATTVTTPSPEPIYFTSADEMRQWLAEHHSTDTQLVVGYWKKHTGRPSLTWSQAVDEALCVGWIDGVARRVDDERHIQRFTPRKPGSTWSKVNIAKVEALTAAGHMLPPGRAAFQARTEARSGIYSFEQDPAALEPTPRLKESLLARPGAWEWFMAQAPSYRRAAVWWVISAKREETTTRRLATLVEDSAAGRRLKHLDRP